MHNVDPRPPATAIDAYGWPARVCLFTGLALTSYGVATYLSGADSVGVALHRIGGNAMVAGVTATIVSLLVRAGRWQLIFQRLGHRLPYPVQVRIYLSGLALSSTPGKVGETSRSLLLRPYGVPYADSLAAFICDRLSDVIGVAALGAVMAALAGTRHFVLEGIAVVSLLGSLALAALWRSQPDGAWLTRRWRWVARAVAPAAIWARSWRGGSLAIYMGMAALAYGIQGMIFAAFVAQVYTGMDWTSCLVIFMNATLIGAASMVPGGLGTMDAALVVQLQSAGVPAGEALAAAIATRACTLWVAWTLGLCALLTFSRSSLEP